MFDVSSSVIDAFKPQTKHLLVADICDAIMADHADIAGSPQELYRFVSIEAERADTMGLLSKRTVGLYVLAAFLLGLEVIEEARVPERLAAFGTDEEAKSEWLAAWLFEIEQVLS